MSNDRNPPATKQGLSVVTLFYGIFLLLVLLLFAGATFGVGTPELGLWLVLLVGWVSFWVVKRRR